ncbi:DnaJ family domain-containing protein [Cohnella yongneupensis]|uniref:DnaJ family domain-containing protein n=1 Tax=Cohnella yongneupensis TaxID=425006 RepID=A0ABW0R2U9_9BACL
MNWAASLAEEKIREAQLRGEFDNLPGAGKPLPEDDELRGVPEELRTGFKLLKDAGMLPEEMQLRKDMVTLQDLLLVCRDEPEKLTLTTQLNAKKLRYRMLMEERGWSGIGAFAEYEEQIQRKMTEQ